jgi:hypothetical protein
MHSEFTKSAKMTLNIFDQKTKWGIRKAKFMLISNLLKWAQTNVLEESYRQKTMRIFIFPDFALFANLFCSLIFMEHFFKPSSKNLDSA